jgi:CRP-like cAMP-binding protein
MLPGTNLDKIKRYFYDNGTRLEIPRKDIIIFQGDAADDVYFVNKGIYKVYNIDQLGEERTISIVGRNNIFPLSSHMTHNPDDNAFYFYEAYTDMVVYKTSQEKFREMLSKNPKLVYYLMDALARSYVGLESRIQNLQKSKVEEKTEFVLYFLAMRLGRSIDGEIYEINKHITGGADFATVNRNSVNYQDVHQDNRQRPDRINRDERHVGKSAKQGDYDCHHPAKSVPSHQRTGRYNHQKRGDDMDPAPCGIAKHPNRVGCRMIYRGVLK